MILGAWKNISGTVWAIDAHFRRVVVVFTDRSAFRCMLGMSLVFQQVVQVMENEENIGCNQGDGNVDHQGYVGGLVSTLYRRNQKRNLVPSADQEKVVDAIQISQFRVMALWKNKSNTGFNANTFTGSPFRC